MNNDCDVGGGAPSATVRGSSVIIEVVAVGIVAVVTVVLLGVVVYP